MDSPLLIWLNRNESAQVVGIGDEPAGVGMVERATMTPIDHESLLSTL
jgi:hypothetical protein